MDSGVDKARVMIAGIGGASLGTEILKCLRLADRYSIFGCDISPNAYGHFADGFVRTAVVDRSRYVESVLDVCRHERIEVIVPGGEQPLFLLSEAASKLRSADVRLAANSTSVVSRFTDKHRTFELLRDLGIPTPATALVEARSDLTRIPTPCVVKPATGSGGSSFVFLADTHDEAWLYASYLIKMGRKALVQEYVSHEGGEFTVGVLSLPDSRMVGSIALRRALESKLSVLVQSKTGVISTGYSQGLIEDFPAVRATAERIAKAAGSVGPLNIQGRVRDGVFLPFEINPRFSASTFLRALAGFNEVDLYLQFVLRGVEPRTGSLRYGHYLRSLTEVFAPVSGSRS